MKTQDVADGGKYWRSVAVGLVVLVCMMLTTAPFVIAKGNPNPGVLPPHSNSYGMTYGEWGAAWWEWAFSTDFAALTDETGEDCGVGQAGKVWFLAGTRGGDPVARDCTVPPGRSIFFPIVNVVYVGDLGETEDEMRGIVNSIMDGATNLEVVVDGVPLQSLESYRADSPLFTLLGHDSVADGFWIMLPPLSVGTHTVDLRGEIPFFSVVIDVTYDLTIGR